MASGGVNKVILIGNLGADPELRQTQGGQSVCDLRMATNESWNDKNGQRQERTEWHRVIFWGKPAEIIKQYMSKGRRLYIEGRLQTRSWEDKQGQKRYTTEIVGNDFMFLDSGGDRAQAGGGRSDYSQSSGGSFGGDYSGDFPQGGGRQDDYSQATDDEIPF